MMKRQVVVTLGIMVSVLLAGCLFTGGTGTGKGNLNSVLK
jgi:predicted small secreted protein